MPRMTSETIVGRGDLRWQGSIRGTFTGRSEVLNTPAFTKATHFPDGFIPSGMPVSKVAGELVPYDPTEVTGNAASFAGHLLTDQRIVDPAEKLNVALLDHGRVLTSFLPVEFVAPAVQPNSTIVYLEA